MLNSLYFITNRDKIKGLYPSAFRVSLKIDSAPDDVPKRGEDNGFYLHAFDLPSRLSGEAVRSAKILLIFFFAGLPGILSRFRILCFGPGFPAGFLFVF